MTLRADEHQIMAMPAQFARQIGADPARCAGDEERAVAPVDRSMVCRLWPLRAADSRRLRVPDREDFDISAAPAVGNNVIADNQPARPGRARVGKIRQVPFRPAERCPKTLGGPLTVFGKKGGDLLGLGRRAP